MKQARLRQRPARRDRTPAAIGLAPPKPPLTPPRADAPALPLTDADEPLAITAPSRQLRRQERRVQSKAARRGKPGAPGAPPVATLPEDLSPLPRARALAKPRSRALVILDRLVRPWRRAAPIATSPAAELDLLRRQLGAAQATLDRLLLVAQR